MGAIGDPHRSRWISDYCAYRSPESVKVDGESVVIEQSPRVVTQGIRKGTKLRGGRGAKWVWEHALTFKSP